MTKELRCGDIIEGCDHVVRGETEEEVMRKGAEHGRQAHGIENMDEETRRKVRSRIQTV